MTGETEAVAVPVSAPEAPASATPAPAPELGGIDIDKATDAIAQGLGFKSDDNDADEPTDSDDLTLAPEDKLDPEPAPDKTEATPEDRAPRDRPSSWRKEAMAVWEQIPEVARSEIMKREEDILRGLGEAKHATDFSQAYIAAHQQFLPVLQHYGVDPIAHSQQLMAVHYGLSMGTPAQKVEIFRSLLQNFGINPSMLGEDTEALDPPAADPRVDHLTQRLHNVESHSAAMSQHVQTQLRQSYESQLKAFAADTAHPHFYDVADDIARLIENGEANSLQDAYDKAVWLNPQSRQKLQQAEFAKTRAAETKRAEEARKAASANLRSSVKSAVSSAPHGSMEETLARTLATIKSRDSA